MLAALDKPDLAVPRLRTGSMRTVEVRPRRIRNWIEELPLSDTGAAAARLYQALYALNRVPLFPENRLELLEVYREPATTLSETLRRSFCRLPLPLTGRSRRMAELRRGLELEMATGYKRVVHDTLAMPRKASRDKHLADALARTLEHTGRVLYSCFEVYVPCPVGTWRELHQTYGYADSHGLASHTTEGGESLSTHYVRALLLGLSNPYGLLQGDCERVWRFVNARPLRAVIHTDFSSLEPEGRFLISMALDSPPIQVPQTPLDPKGNVWVLDALPVVRDLRELCGQIESGSPPASISRVTDIVDDSYLDLLHRLEQCWGEDFKRQSTRTPRSGAVAMCIGLNAAHHFLNGGETDFIPQPVAVSDAPVEDTGVEDVADDEYSGQDMVTGPTTYVDLDDLIEHEAEVPGADDAFEDMPVEGAQGGDDAGTANDVADQAADTGLQVGDTRQGPGAFQLYGWQVHDEGAGGMALRYQGREVVQMRVGDVVLVRGGKPPVWDVAAVRWMKSALTADFLEIGIQRLAPGVRAVEVRPVPQESGNAAKADTDTEAFASALLLPAIEQLKQPASLLVPRGIKIPDRRLQMRNGKEEPETVQVASVMERTGAYERLAFVRGQDAPKTSVEGR